MRKIWHDEAWEDYLYWQMQDKKIVKKIHALLKSIERNGYDCEGKPEALAGDFSGFWSVRIDRKKRNRIQNLRRQFGNRTMRRSLS